MGEEAKKPFNKILLYILIVFMVLTGSANSIFNKILQKQEGKHFLFEQHHWIITFGMFLGELVSIFFYIYIVIKRKRDQQKKKDAGLLEKDENKTEEIKTEEGKEGEVPEKKEYTQNQTNYGINGNSFFQFNNKFNNRSNSNTFPNYTSFINSFPN